MTLTLSLETARRFILGKQGLWPGRRWQGKEGAAAAMYAVEHLQLDPLNITARSHDLMLHSRVLDYSPAYFDELTYQDRRFFDWGGWLAVRPMEELPHWRVLMQRERLLNRGWVAFAQQHAAVIDEMRAVLKQRGTVSNRQFEMSSRQRHESYRGRKDSALALYYLWRMGEVMIHHRAGFERVYALAEQIAPAHLLGQSSDDEAERYLLKKMVGFYGLHPFSTARGELQRKVSPAEMKSWRQQLLDTGELVQLNVAGWPREQYALGSDLPLIEELAAGRTPSVWQPLATSNAEECLFLAPLDPVSARGRASQLFGFDYVWEVYKPLPQRKWGYYVLPVLWGDRLVARFDAKLDRKSNTLIIPSFWLEEAATGNDKGFGEAFARGMARFMRFLGTDKLEASSMQPVALQKRLLSIIK
jgi:uncharacterized protein